MLPEIPFHDGYALAYDEARRALEEQARSVGELRSRAGVLMTTAAIATSFLGGLSVPAHGLGPAAWIALACFALSGVTVLAALWPRRDWELVASPGALLTTFVEPVLGSAAAIHVIHRELALHLDVLIAHNRAQIGRLGTLLRTTSTLIAIEVLSWVVSLAVST